MEEVLPQTRTSTLDSRRHTKTAEPAVVFADVQSYSPVEKDPNDGPSSTFRQETDDEGRPVEVNTQTMSRDEVRRFANRRRTRRDSDADSKSGNSDDNKDYWSDEDEYDIRIKTRRPFQDEFEPYDKFELALSQQSFVESSRDPDQSDLDTGEIDELPAQKVDPKSRGSQATSIFASRYTGDAELGGDHGVTLTALHGPRGQSQPLFRWLYVWTDDPAG